jgi:hypothetical protein
MSLAESSAKRAIWLELQRDARRRAMSEIGGTPFDRNDPLGDGQRRLDRTPSRLIGGPSRSPSENKLDPPYRSETYRWPSGRAQTTCGGPASRAPASKRAPNCLAAALAGLAGTERTPETRARGRRRRGSRASAEATTISLISNYFSTEADASSSDVRSPTCQHPSGRARHEAVRRCRHARAEPGVAHGSIDLRRIALAFG